MMAITDTIRDHVMSNHSAAILKKTAIREGLVTLRMDGAKKVIRGISTIDEIIRVTLMDIL